MTLRLFVLLCLALVVSSCEEKVSTLGAPYYRDTVQFNRTIRTDTGFMTMRPVSVPRIVLGGNTYSITLFSPLLIVGKVTQGENIESWGVLQFPTLPDTTIAKVVGIRLLLKDQTYKYGDTTTSPNRLDLQVYEYSPLAGAYLDSLTSLSKSALVSTPLGSFQGDFADVNDSVLAFSIDTSIVKKDLRSASLAFVVAPGATMTTARGFGSMESGDTNARPQIEYSIKVDTGILVTRLTALKDLHIAMDQSDPTPAGEFMLRGSTGWRVFDTLSLTRPGDTAQLTAFSTINSAELILSLDPARSRRSTLSFDTAGPAIVQLLGTNDTGAALFASGYHDASDPNIYHFQIRTLVEYWLRNPTKNFGFELRAGYNTRTFVAGDAFGVEDNTINRWTFYGQDATDPTKRPKFILSYSKLP
ncbi:MAG: hypothetical protein Q8921_05005 [Bacteroidota bacterium]|nr:hypothetical protein [Bacteroidota bacterium]